MKNEDPIKKVDSYWVIIPCHNEEESIPIVCRGLQSLESPPSRILVVDNNSSDNTADVARVHGATVLREGEMGYGIACQKAIHYIQSQDTKPDCVVFMDGDNSDDPLDTEKLLKPIAEGLDIVLGSRTLGNPEPGSLTFLQRFGNALSCFLLRILYGIRFTDLGPFRAIRTKTLFQLKLLDRNFGWTIELQAKIAEENIPYKEVPVNYRNRRLGVSKVSGNAKAVVRAGFKIIYTIFYWFFHYRLQRWESMPWISFITLTITLLLTSVFTNQGTVLPLFLGVSISFLLLFYPRHPRNSIITGVVSNLKSYGNTYKGSSSSYDRSIHRMEEGRFYVFTGILIRIPFLFLIPLLSNDWIRTLWDAELIWNGKNPYLWKPTEIMSMIGAGQWLGSSIEFMALFDRLNSPEFYSFYPPIQHLLVFIGMVPGMLLEIITTLPYPFYHVFGLKLLFLGLEVGNLILLKHLLPNREDNLRFYAWNPLIILEGIGNLHFEIATLFFILLALKDYKTQFPFSGISFSLGVGTKIIPILAYPFLVLNRCLGRSIGVKKHRAGMMSILLPLSIVLLGYGFFLQEGIANQWNRGLGLYSHSFEFFSYLNYYIRIGLGFLGYDFRLLGIWVWLGTGCIYLLVLFWAVKKSMSLENFLFLSLSLIFLLSPILHPWYLIPWTALGIILGYRFAIPTGLLVYSSYIYYAVTPFQRNELVVGIAYLLFLILLLWEFYEHKRHRDHFRNSRRSLRNLH